MAVKNLISHTILNSSKWSRLHRIYYKLVVQYFYLLLITAATCFDHNSWPPSGSYQVSLMYTAYVATYAEVVDFIHQCLNTIEILNP